MTPEERIKYADILKNPNITESMLETALIEGELKQAKYSAKKLIEDGFSNQNIAELLELNIEEIETLRKEIT